MTLLGLSSAPPGLRSFYLTRYPRPDAVGYTLPPTPPARILLPTALILCRCVYSLSLDGDGHVAVRGRLVAAEVGGDDAERVVAGRERGRVPRPASRDAAADGVRDFVEEARLLAPVNRDAARVGVGDLRRVRVGWQAVELDVDARLVEAGGGRAVRGEQLVAELVESEPTPRLIPVNLIVSVNDDPHATAHDEPPAALLGQARARLVEELNAVALNRRRDVV